MVIMHRGKAHPVHRCFMAKSSHVFRKWMSLSWGVKTKDEQGRFTFSLSDQGSPWALRQLIKYCYGIRLPGTAKKKDIAELFALAEELWTPSLVLELLKIYSVDLETAVRYRTVFGMQALFQSQVRSLGKSLSFRNKSVRESLSQVVFLDRPGIKTILRMDLECSEEARVEILIHWLKSSKDHVLTKDILKCIRLDFIRETAFFRRRVMTCKVLAPYTELIQRQLQMSSEGRSTTSGARRVRRSETGKTYPTGRASRLRDVRNERVKLRECRKLWVSWRCCRIEFDILDLFDKVEYLGVGVKYFWEGRFAVLSFRSATAAKKAVWVLRHSGSSSLRIRPYDPWRINFMKPDFVYSLNK